MSVDILRLSKEATHCAMKVIEDTNVVGIWESLGCQVNLVGSLRTGLIMKHRDIDFHIYSDQLSVSTGFAALSRMAENPRIKHAEFTNLSDTDENCIEWHAWYHTDDGEEPWQLDMIHILRGSYYDGYMEKVADGIMRILTPETKRSILQIKLDTPDTEKIMGIEYYVAVLRDGVRNYAEFTDWRKANPVEGVSHWQP